jgi:hypothetical protein
MESTSTSLDVSHSSFVKASSPCSDSNTSMVNEVQQPQLAVGM